MAFTESDLLEALKAVIDPNTGKDFVSTKQLKNLKVEGDLRREVERPAGGQGFGRCQRAPGLEGLAQARGPAPAAPDMVREHGPAVCREGGGHRRPLPGPARKKPSIQSLERAQGWLRLPDGKAVRGHTHEYKRHGTTTLFAALEVHTGLVQVGHYRRKRRREFLDFMNSLVAQYPDRELHVVLDNFVTHKPRHDRWLSTHKKVHFHYTPTHASWLNQVEVWFSILTRAVLLGLSTTDPRQVCLAIDTFTKARNKHPSPFEWTKSAVHPKSFEHRYADLCK